VRNALLSILFIPWCQSLLANKGGNSGLPATVRPLKSAVIYLGRIPLHSSKHKDLELSYARGKQGDILGGGVVNGTAKDLPREQRRHKEQQIYLFSLNWIQESDPEYFLKKDIRRLWEWKDTTLGDGRDFFVPKPKTLMALQQYLLENIPDLTECSIISNCARLEVLCCYSCSIPFEEHNINERGKREEQPQEILARAISNCFLTQLDHHKNVSKNGNAWSKMVMQLPINADRPESLLTRKKSPMDLVKPVSYYDSWWNVTLGPRSILTHICKVSAGMGRRPRRPDRPVVFRPFSSRDAHILLQLKRTRENIGFAPLGDEEGIGGQKSSGKNCIKESKSHGVFSQTRQGRKRKRKRKVLPLILDCALRAGKAARNSDIVPEIEELKEMTSADSSRSSASEQQTSQRVASIAFKKGIHPLIAECVAKLGDSTNNIDRQIAEFRRNAFAFLLEIESDDTAIGDDRKALQQELRTWLNRRLHEPTIKLRSLSRQQSGKIDYDNSVGTNEDVESFLSDSLNEIRDELRREHRRRRGQSRLNLKCKI